MVKNFKRILAFLLAVTFVWINQYQPIRTKAETRYPYLNQVQSMTIGDEPEGNNGQLATLTFWDQYEWWHYSNGNGKPGYWKCTMPNGTQITIKDTEYKVWNDINEIAEDKRMQLIRTVPVPDVVQNYLDKGGNIKASIDINGGYSMDSNLMYKNTPIFTITNSGSTFFFNMTAMPQFVCHTKISYSYLFPELGDYGFVPVPDQNYGRNIYSIFDANKHKEHLGMAYSTYTGEALKIDYSTNSTLIDNIDGSLKPGKKIQISTGSGTITRDSGTIKIGDGTFKNVGAIGVVFYYPMKVTFYKADTPPDLEDTITETNPIVPGSTEGSTKAGATGVIKADTRGKEKFDVSKGIPSSEKLYTSVSCKNMIENFKFVQKKGTVHYQVNVNTTYNLSWTEQRSSTSNWHHQAPDFCMDADEDGINDYCPGHETTSYYDEKMTDTKHGTQTYNISYDYAYWVIDKLDVYGIEKAVIKNSALPSGSVTLTPSGISMPTVQVEHSNNAGDHVTMPSKFTYDSESGTYVMNIDKSVDLPGYSYVPDSKIEDNRPLADQEIAKDPVKVKNDKLIVNGTAIMDQLPCAFCTDSPNNMPNPTTIGKDVLYKSSLHIDNTELNGVKNSTGTIYYKRVDTPGVPAGDDQITEPVNNINSVTVHTPVVCYAGILNDQTYNQMLKPDNTRTPLILDMPSQIKIPTEGDHLDIKGYGNRDYSAYTKAKQVKFPFDVYIDTTFRETGKYLKANTWHSEPLNTEIINFYIPTWVDEGNYTINFREIAINSPDPDENTQAKANLDINNYVATDSKPVQVSGRLYGFKITDIEDYPLWENVFRVKAKTAKHKGNYYWVGTKNQNGNSNGTNSLFTLPVLNGSHPEYKNKGALKTGYAFKFELESIGNYSGEKDCIQINPTFWYVNKDGSGKKRVDLYYNEKYNGKEHYFIKVGSDQDYQNTHYIKLADPYRNVPDSQIDNTCKALGIDKKVFTGQKAKLGWYDSIVLSKPLRTFIGATNDLPSGVAWKDAIASKQHWYGQYMLPDKCYAVPQGYNVTEYAKKNNGLNGKEPIWLRNGYIIVNFDITTVKNGDFDHPFLSYYNAPNCNMWETEGYDYTKKDYSGAVFSLADGDTVFYYADKRSSDDYGSGVTH